MAMGGIGEAAMLGAVMGGGSAMLTGGDPLKGALMGGLTGGIGGAVSPALSAMTAPTAATLAPTIAPAVAEAAIAPTIANQGIATLASGLPATTAQGILTTIAPGSMVAPSAVSTAVAPVASVAPSVIPPATSQSFGNILGSGSSTLPGIPTTPPPSTFMEGMAKFAKDPMASLMDNKFTAAGSALAGANAGKKKKEEEEKYAGPLSRFRFNPDTYSPASYADGGITSLGGYDRMVGEQPMYQAMARGGIANLGSYSDGGRMLKGPGDGMSDSIPANIAGKRPARLADGEFVIPADVVSHLGNGSTDAGAKQLYAMMAKVRKARTGSKAQGREINPHQYMAA